MTNEARAVEQHYTLEDLGGRILDALREAGVDVGALTSDDLAAVDEFHIRGREATEKLAAAAAPSASAGVGSESPLRRAPGTQR
jgi:hypothetical protein